MLNGRALSFSETQCVKLCLAYAGYAVLNWCKEVAYWNGLYEPAVTESANIQTQFGVYTLLARACRSDLFTI